MQRLASGALLNGAAGAELWLDGGHNAEGGRVAAAALGDLEERVSRPLVVIVGMMANKDAGAFLANFAGLTRHIIAVRIPTRKARCRRTGCGCRPRARHARGNLDQPGSGAARAGAPRLRSAAAHPDHGIALSRRPCARANGTLPDRFDSLEFRCALPRLRCPRNVLALQAVIADIRAQGIEEIVNLGDMASGPLDARRTMDALMALDAVHVLGNHDAI